MTMCTIEEKHPPSEKKLFFYKQKLEQVRACIGTDNIDQDEKEEVLTKIITKMTAVYIGCLAQIEQTLGAEMWGYEVPPEILSRLSAEEQLNISRRAKIWSSNRAAIITAGEKRINDVIGILQSVIFSPKEYIDDTNKFIMDLEAQIEALTEENLELKKERETNE